MNNQIFARGAPGITCNDRFLPFMNLFFMLVFGLILFNLILSCRVAMILISPTSPVPLAALLLVVLVTVSASGFMNSYEWS